MIQLQLLALIAFALLCTSCGAVGLIWIGQQTAPVRVIQVVHSGTLLVKIENGHMMYTPRGRERR